MAARVPKSFDEFFDWQDGKYTILLKAVHGQVQHMLPGVTTKFQWGGPHYHYQGHLAYLAYHTASSAVYVAFIHGFQLSNAHGLLNNDGDTTMVKKLFIHDLPDLSAKLEILRETLIEAAMINEERKKLGK